jgi:hypothetical protein
MSWVVSPITRDRVIKAVTHGGAQHNDERGAANERSE